jgi:hypothetical protein
MNSDDICDHVSKRERKASNRFLTIQNSYKRSILCHNRSKLLGDSCQRPTARRSYEWMNEWMNEWPMSIMRESVSITFISQHAARYRGLASEHSTDAMSRGGVSKPVPRIELYIKFQYHTRLLLNVLFRVRRTPDHWESTIKVNHLLDELSKFSEFFPLEFWCSVQSKSPCPAMTLSLCISSAHRNMISVYTQE